MTHVIRIIVVSALETQTANVLVCLLSFFLLLHIPLSHRILHSLLLPGNMRDRLETFTHCAERSRLAVEHFLSKNYLRQKDNYSHFTARHHEAASGPVNSQTGGMTLKHCSDAVCTLTLRASQRALGQVTPGNGHTSPTLDDSGIECC